MVIDLDETMAAELVSAIEARLQMLGIKRDRAPKRERHSHNARIALCHDLRIRIAAQCIKEPESRSLPP